MKDGIDFVMLILIPPIGNDVAVGAASNCTFPSMDERTVVCVVSMVGWTVSSSAVIIGSSSVK